MNPHLHAEYSRLRNQELARAARVHHTVSGRNGRIRPLGTRSPRASFFARLRPRFA
jgi:hypothetical protein